MLKNKYFNLWWPIFGLHTLHQIEESIGFFQWYVAYADKIPDWLLILDVENARRVVIHPEYFIVATIIQLGLVLSSAFLFRRNEYMTQFLILLYLFGLSFFLIWHILTGYLAHSYPPIMITCILGLYLIPQWTYRLLDLVTNKNT